MSTCGLLPTFSNGMSTAASVATLPREKPTVWSGRLVGDQGGGWARADLIASREERVKGGSEDGVWTLRAAVRDRPNWVMRIRGSIMR